MSLFRSRIRLNSEFPNRRLTTRRRAEKIWKNCSRKFAVSEDHSASFCSLGVFATYDDVNCGKRQRTLQFDDAQSRTATPIDARVSARVPYPHTRTRIEYTCGWWTRPAVKRRDFPCVELWMWNRWCKRALASLRRAGFDELYEKRRNQC